MPEVTDDVAVLASELRVTLGRIFRRLRSEHTFSLAQGTVLGSLEREGPRSISDLAAIAHVRPQSMAQTVRELEETRLVTRRADPDDARRVFIDLTAAGLVVLESERRHREGWLARVLAEELTPGERALLHDAAPILRRLADS
jgi:DNA-binding MarR family transcriptional regulator